jgi:hypothetical protein
VVVDPAEAAILIGGNGTDLVLVCHDGVNIPRGPLDANGFRWQYFAERGMLPGKLERGRRAPDTISG